jgi:hypothetical protein
MSDSQSRGGRGARAAAVLVAGLGAAFALGEPARADAGYSSDGQAAVVRWHEAPAEIAATQAAVSLTVYGDGRVTVLRGRGRRDAGQYTLHLSRSELDALVQVLVDGGVPSFDAAAVAHEKRATATRRAAEARAAGPVTVHVTSDVATTTIEVRLDQGERTVVWPGVREDARDHPEIAALQGLAAADAALRALAGDPRLERAD